MTSNVVTVFRSESVRISFLRMAAAGQRLQAGLATWFDLLHKRSPEDRIASIFDFDEIVNGRSVVFASGDGASQTKMIFVGVELTRMHEAIAVETVRSVNLATPIAFTHEWERGGSVNSLVLPFRHPSRAVVLLFDW